MNDDELLEALRTGLDAVDPPPASLRAKALDAGRWPRIPAVEAEVRSDGDLVGSGMRSDAPQTIASGLRDLAFRAAGHDIVVTVDATAALGHEIEVAVIVTPRVESIVLVSPFGDPDELALDEAGHAEARLDQPAVAIEFRAVSGELVRTPLIRLY